MSRRKALRSKRHQWNETDLETVRMVGRMMEAHPELVRKLKVKMAHTLDVNRWGVMQTKPDPMLVGRRPKGTADGL